MPKNRYVISDDESGHEYLIPERMLGYWYKWINSQDWEDGIVPEYAIPIDGTLIIHEFSFKK